MVHNLVKITLSIGILASIYHFIYVHFFMGNSPIELLIAIGVLTLGTAMFFMNRQDVMTKGLLALGLILLVVHFIYAHLLKGNSPLDIQFAIFLTAIGVGIVLLKKIDFKKS